MEAFPELEQRHSVVVRPVLGPAEASGIDCVWPWSAGLLAVVGTAFHPVTVEVDGLVLICEGCSLHTRASAAGRWGTRPNRAPGSSGPAAWPRLQSPAAGLQACGLASPCFLGPTRKTGPRARSARGTRVQSNE